MARPTDNETPAPEQPPVQEDRAGRVVVDSRGRNVWQWAKAALDSTSILLKRLENQDLALEPTQTVPIIKATDPRAAAKAPPAGNKQAAPAKPGGKPADDRAAQKSANRSDPTRSDPTRGPKRNDSGGGFDPYNSR